MPRPCKFKEQNKLGSSFIARNMSLASASRLMGFSWRFTGTTWRNSSLYMASTVFNNMGQDPSVTITSCFCAQNSSKTSSSNPKSFICFEHILDSLALMLSTAVTQTKSCSCCWRKHSMLMLLYPEVNINSNFSALKEFQGTGIANFAPLLTPLCKTSRTCQGNAVDCPPC